MRKLVIVADMHIHPWRLQSRDGGHDRLLDGLSVLRQSLTLAQRHGAIWIMAGDFKQPKTNWPQEALTGAHEILRAPEFEKVKKILLAGNHDGNGIGGSGLAPFKDCAFVVEELTECSTPDMILAPWNADLGEVKELVTKHPDAILIGHGFLQGCMLGPEDTRIAKGIPRTELGDFPVAFFGDVHKSQWLSNTPNRPPTWRPMEASVLVGWERGDIFYAGSPYQQNWGERNEPKGALLVDLDTSEVLLCPLTAPKYHHFEFDERGIVSFLDPKASDHLKDDFVRIVYTGGVHDALDELRDMADEFRSFQLILRRPQKATTRAEVHAGLDMPEMLARYMEARPVPEGIDSAKMRIALIQLTEAK